MNDLVGTGKNPHSPTNSPTPPIPPAPQAPIPAYGDNIHLRQDGHLHHYKAQKQVV